MRVDLVVEGEHVEVGAQRRDLHRDVVDVGPAHPSAQRVEPGGGLVVAEDGLAEQVDVDGEAVARAGADVAGERRVGGRDDHAARLGADAPPDDRRHRTRVRPMTPVAASRSADAVRRRQRGREPGADEVAELGHRAARVGRAQHLVGEGEQQLAPGGRRRAAGRGGRARRRSRGVVVRRRRRPAAARPAGPPRRRVRRRPRTPLNPFDARGTTVAVLCVVGDLVEDVVVRLASAPARGTDTPAVIARSAAAAAPTSPRRLPWPAVRSASSGGSATTPSASARGRPGRRGRRRARAARRATGTIVVLVEPGGERTMLPDRGAAAQLGPVEPAWLDGVTWVHVPAYSLCAEPIGAAHASSSIAPVRGPVAHGSASTCRRSAVVAAFGAERFAALLDRLAPDVVFANARRGRAGRRPVDPPLLVVKDGARPVVLRRRRRERGAGAGRRRRRRGRHDRGRRRLRRRLPRRHARRRRHRQPPLAPEPCWPPAS